MIAEAARKDHSVTKCAFVPRDWTRRREITEIAGAQKIGFSRERTVDQTNVRGSLKPPRERPGIALEQALLDRTESDGARRANRVTQRDTGIRIKPRRNVDRHDRNTRLIDFLDQLNPRSRERAVEAYPKKAVNDQSRTPVD